MGKGFGSKDPGCIVLKLCLKLCDAVVWVTVLWSCYTLRLAKMRLTRVNIIPKRNILLHVGWETLGRGNWRGTMRHMDMKMQIGGSHVRETPSIGSLTLRHTKSVVDPR